MNGVDLVPLSEDEMRPHRWDRISMVFQAAMNSLDPVYRVGDQIVEALEAHSSSAGQDAMERVTRAVRSGEPRPELHIALSRTSTAAG